MKGKWRPNLLNYAKGQKVGPRAASRRMVESDWAAGVWGAGLGWEGGAVGRGGRGRGGGGRRTGEGGKKGREEGGEIQRG
jgi:hypothetical protein